MFFKFKQNSSFGRYDVNDNISKYVVIEAASKEEAMQMAETLGIYFDGVSKGIDCPCCGDRWAFPELISFPYKENFIANNYPCPSYSFNATAHNIEDLARFIAIFDREDVTLHYLNGSKKLFSESILTTAERAEYWEKAWDSRVPGEEEEI